MKGIFKSVLPLLLIFVLAGCMQEQTGKKSTKEFMKITKEKFGMVDSTEVFLFTLTNDHGMVVKITNYGGIVTSILAPDKDGKFADVVLGFDNLESYLDGHPYFGCIVGRYGNRIANGKFSVDGEEYTLAQNNDMNHLHGGIKGFDKVIWDAEEMPKGDTSSLRLRYISPDGEEGYPGNLRTSVIYSLTNNNELIIDYRAKTDKSGPLNLTHHSYFNLSGTQENIFDHRLTIAAYKYVVVNENLIPTGELRDVRGTDMDFTSTRKIGERINNVPGGYDHTYVLINDGNLLKVADFYHHASGRAVEVFTTEPGIQFYSGNFLDGSIIGKDSIVYNQHHGFCLETQHFPDSPNQSKFPSTLLKSGEKFKSTTIYKFTTK